MDCPSEKVCPLGLDFDNSSIRTQLGYIHLVVSEICRTPIPAQSIIELYLLKTFRENSPYVHAESTHDIEMQALYNYLGVRIPYIESFLDATNANILQTNQEA